MGSDLLGFDSVGAKLSNLDHFWSLVGLLIIFLI